MATAWAKMLNEQAGDALRAALEDRKDTTTALALARALEGAGFVLKARDGKLVLSHPDGKKPDEAQKTAILKHKDDLLVLLSTGPAWDFPIDWKTEWALERDLLLRYAAAMPHGPDRDRLLQMATEVPTSEASWLELGYRMIDLAYELKQAGKLPPAVSLVGPVLVAPG